MAKTPLIAAASLLLALTFTISCSESGEDSGQSSRVSNLAGGISFTESHELEYLTKSFFAYSETWESNECESGGNILTESYRKTFGADYSISNNVLVWENYVWENNDTLHFTGTSNNLTGTWTRTKNKSTSCEFRTLSYGRDWECKEGWEIVKAEFTGDTVKITSDICVAEELDGEENNGWKTVAIDCNTLEISKGMKKVTQIATLSGKDVSSVDFTYNGKTCTHSANVTISQEEDACKRAWEEYGSINERLLSYYYTYFLYYDSFYDCLEKKEFPLEAFGLAKPLPKPLQKFPFKITNPSQNNNKIITN